MVVPPTRRLCWVTDCSGLGGSVVSFLAASGFGVSAAGFSSPRARGPTKTAVAARTVMGKGFMLEPPCRNLPRPLPPPGDHTGGRGAGPAPLWSEAPHPPHPPATGQRPL